MPQLDSTFFTSQLGWLIFTFIGIYAFISLYFFPAIGNIISNRKAKVDTFIQAAETLFAKQRQLNAQIHTLLDEAKQNAYKVKLDAITKSESIIAESLVAIDKKIQNDLQDDENRLNNLSKMIQNEINIIANELASEIVTMLNHKYTNK